MKHPNRLGLLIAFSWIISTATLDVACPEIFDWRQGISPLDAQVATAERLSVVATYDAGRFYNYAAGEWTLGHVSGLEVSRGMFAASGSLSLDRSGIFERAIACTLTKSHGRVEFNASAALYSYPRIGFDTLGSVGVRVTLR